MVGATEQGGGDVIVLSAPGGALVLPDGADDHLAARLRQALLDADALGAVVDALAVSGVQGLPSFCGVFPRGSHCRVLVRGDGVASVSFGEGTTIDVVARTGMTTWREEIFDGAVAVALRSNTGARPLIEVLLSPGAQHAPPADPGDTPRPAPGLRSEPSARSVLAGTSEPVVPPSPHPDLTLVAAFDLADAGPEQDLLPADGPTEQLEPIEPRPSLADEPEFDFSHLLEHTQYRGAEAAAVRLPEPPADDAAADPLPARQAAQEEAPASPVPPAGSPGAGRLIDGIPSRPTTGPAPPLPPTPHAAPTDGDHDGFTMAASALRGIVGAPRPAKSAPPLSPVSGIQAVFCVVDHPNPPHASQCRSCGGAIVDRRVRSIARPALGRLRFSSGAVVELDRPQLIGRRPTVDPAQPASELPALVTVPDPDEAVSRVHAEVRLEGWEVFVVDRGSKNGTFVEIPGQAPTKLRPGEPCLIVAGTRVTLADVSTFEFEVGGP